ncbi:MAG: SurA N-terminal domain-containing protein [Treponema sp.]|nr:SurA N-terminal domain-containing protein [Treponema sp.]MCL2251016.1 SurA N-terminal domain-containing protein [Treponema sp.]
MKKTLFFILISLITVSVFAQSFDLKTIAVVNLIRSVPITGRQLRTEVEYRERVVGQAMPQTQRIDVLDDMINEQLVLQAAERDRITITENEVNQNVQQLRSMLAQNLNRQPTDAEFAQALRNEFHMDEAGYRERIRKQLILQKFIMTKKESLLRTAQTLGAPSADEINYLYNMRRQDLVRYETVEFTYIQIPFGQDATARTRARELGERLIREINSDTSRFDSIADRASPSAGYVSDMGSVPRHQVSEQTFGRDFVNEAFRLRQGQVSGLIESNAGYLIIKIIRNLEFKNLELDDIVPSYLLPQGVDPRARTTVRNLLTAMIQTEKQQGILKQATDEIIAELRTNRSFQIHERNLVW